MVEQLTPEQKARVEKHAELVPRIARWVRMTYRQIEADELSSVGYEALVRAAMRYDPAGGASFSTYAHYRIRGAMIDAVRDCRPTSRRYLRARTRLQQCQDLLEQADADQRTRDAVGRQTLEERVAVARDLYAKVAMIQVFSECEGGSIQGPGPDPVDPEDLLLDQETRELASELIEELEPTDHRLVAAIYRTGQTIGEYAAQKGTSAATISRRHSKILGTLASWARKADRRT